MDRSLSAATGLTILAVCVVFCSALGLSAQTSGTPSVRQVKVLGSKGAVEIEIEGSDRLVPQPQVLTNPDRLVVDFPNAVPGAQLRNQAVNRGEVKAVRVGRFGSKPPVTRIVLDLNGPQPYQIFPYGRTVMVKVGTVPDAKTAQGRSPTQPGLVNASFAASAVHAPAPPPEPPKPSVLVTFDDGLLTINSDKASLAEVLRAVHDETGADIAIPAGAEQEKVVADLGPGPAPEVLSHLLNGSKFNFLILSAANDPRSLDRVILSPRAEGGVGAPLNQVQARQPVQPLPQDDANNDSQQEPPQEAVQPVAVPPPGRQVPNTPPDTKPPENNDPPD